jgi:hypothetical protein
MKLVAVKNNENINHEWPLSKNNTYFLGRKPQDNPPPGIDLYFDRRVSRKHARIWYERECWWAEDLGSKHGTIIRPVASPGTEREIRGQGKVSLQPGDEILIGDTMLLFTRRSCVKGSAGELSVEVFPAASINYSLVHSGLPVIYEVMVRNRGAVKTAPVQIDINIEGLARSDTLAIPPLEPGHTHIIKNPRLHICLPDLEKKIEREMARLVVSIDSKKVIESNLWILAFDEWSQEEEHRLSIASFVLPNHPLVKKIVMESRSSLKSITGGLFDSYEVLLQSDRPDKAELALQSVYEYLKTEWQLCYSHEPPCFETDSQKVRLPHDVLSNTGKQQGQGTCIDLSALLAGCLEHIGVQPLLILVEIDSQQRHALAGCWRELKYRREPLVKDRKMVLQGAVLVESTGCEAKDCAGSPEKTDYYIACNEARKCVEEHGMLFAVDIDAVRCGPYKITPLPFAGEPKFDLSVVDIMGRAASFTYKYAMDYIGTINLLLAMVETKSGLTQLVLGSLNIDPYEAAKKLEKGMSLPDHKGVANPRRTVHLDQVISSAVALAKREGSPIVLEVHLLTSFLETQSLASDKALKTIGISREEFKNALSQACREAGQAVPFYNEFSQFFTRLQ